MKDGQNIVLDKLANGDCVISRNLSNNKIKWDLDALVCWNIEVGGSGTAYVEDGGMEGVDLYRIKFKFFLR